LESPPPPPGLFPFELLAFFETPDFSRPFGATFDDSQEIKEIKENQA